MRGADLLARTLAEAGVAHVFSLSGNQIMPVYDALLDTGIALTHTRHEGAAVYMAEAHAQLSGGVGVALVTAGAGLGNAVGALMSAAASETPLLLLSGDSPRGQDGRGAFQEVDQASATAALTKLSKRLESPADLATEVADAIALARAGRPGPVHLALPFDLLQAEIDVPPVSPGAVPEEALPTGAADEIRAALAGAQHPLVLLGPALNATRAPGLAESLSEALDAPAFAMESPRGLRDPALGALRLAFEQADLVVSLGKRVDFSTGFGAGGKDWIVADPEAPARQMAAGNLGARLRLALDAPPRPLAQALCARPAPAGRSAWRAQVAALLARRATAPDGGLSSATLCAAVQERIAAAGDAVVICDGGEFGQWAQALTHGAERVVNGVAGAIGGGLPYAIGAAVARPGHPVFAFVGDGTLGFHLAEFETAARIGTPFVLIVGNDRRWNAEVQIQRRDYGPERAIGCELSGARYDLAAAALGAHGEYVTRPEELGPALDRALASGRPACLNVEIEGLPAPSPR